MHQQQAHYRKIRLTISAATNETLNVFTKTTQLEASETSYFAATQQAAF